MASRTSNPATAFIVDGIDLDDLEQEAERVLCRRNFRYFFERAWPYMEPTKPLLPSIAVDGVCAALQAVADRRIRRLAISQPPGTSKSLAGAVAFPAWLLLRSNGRERVMVGSYSWGFATRDSARCRDLVQSEWYRKLVNGTWKIRDDANHKDDWWTSATGRRLITSVDGKSTGERCSIQIMDDALSAADTYSTPAKLEAIRWINEVLSSRLEDQRTDPRVIIGQRLAVDDPIGDVLKRNWRYLCLPALLEDGDEPCELYDDEGKLVWRDPRQVGEPLVALLDAPSIERLRTESLGPAAYAAQYRQKPHDDSTSLFKREWLKRRWTDADLPAEFERQVITLDASFKAGEKSDYAVIQRWGSRGSDRFLLEQWRERAGFVDTAFALKRIAQAHPFAKVLVEEAANGHAVLDQLKREIAGVVGIPPRISGSGITGKAGRAASVQAIVASGCVVLPANAPWLEPWLDEVCSFAPGQSGGHDDQVDAMVYALRELQVTRDIPSPISGYAVNV